MRQSLAKLKTDPLPKALFVHGPERVCQNQIFSALKERVARGPLAEWNWSVLAGHKDFTPEDLFIELGTIPWGGSVKAVVLKEAQLIPAAVMDSIVAWVENTPESNCLAIFSDKLDNRLRYVRRLRKFAWEINCEPLQGDGLIRYVLDYCLQREKRIKRPTAERFLERVGSDLLLIQNELDKLIAWVQDRQEIEDDDVRLLSSLSPSQIANETIFQMTDFIAQKKRQEALGVLRLLLRAGEPPLRILPLIERQLRLLLAVKTRTGSLDETARLMGESRSFPLRKLQRYGENFTLEELFAGFKAVIWADQEMKLGTPGEQVLSDLIVKLTRAV